jgi:enoyl-CoA hydratase/carnithine racemase
MGKTIQITQQGRVLLARLHNPPHALMNDQMVSELAELVARAESDDGIGVVVFTGAQPNIFVAHYDVSELLRAAEESPPITEEQAARASRLTRRLSALTAARPFLQM